MRKDVKMEARAVTNKPLQPARCPVVSIGRAEVLKMFNKIPSFTYSSDHGRYSFSKLVYLVSGELPSAFFLHLMTLTR